MRHHVKGKSPLLKLGHASEHCPTVIIQANSLLASVYHMDILRSGGSGLPNSEIYYDELMKQSDENTGIICDVILQAFMTSL